MNADCFIKIKRRELHVSETRKRPGDALRAREEDGFSLIEMLIAMTLFLIVSAAVFGLLEVARADRFTVTERVELLQGLRFGTNQIGGDLLNAGLDYPTSGALIANCPLTTQLQVPNQRLTAVVSGKAANSNLISGQMTDQVTLAYQDMSFNLDPATKLTNGALNVDTISTNGDSVIAKNPLGTADVAVGDVCLLRSSSSAAIGMVTAVSASGSGADAMLNISFDAGDPLALNQITCNNCFDPSTGTNHNQTIISSVTTPATLTRIKFLTYHVQPDGTLTRTLYGNTSDPSGRQDVALAYDVDGLQLKYVLADGTLTDNPGDPSNPQLAQVRQLLITLSVRGKGVDKRTNQPFKAFLTSTFATRNLGYDTQ